MNAETPKQLEKVQSVTQEEYQDFIDEIDAICGEIPHDNIHAFYLWLAADSPESGLEESGKRYSMAQIYVKNVVEGNMDATRFATWCYDHQLTYPFVQDSSAYTEEALKYSAWYQAELVKREERYENWCKEHGIDCRPGVKMIFSDVEGNECVMKTNFEDRGEMQVV